MKVLITKFPLFKGGILDGRLQEVNKTIQTLESELRRKEIRDAEKNYKQKFVEMKV